MHVLLSHIFAYIIFLEARLTEGYRSEQPREQMSVGPLHASCMMSSHTNSGYLL